MEPQVETSQLKPETQKYYAEVAESRLLVNRTGKLSKALAAAQAEFTLVPKTKVAKVKGQTKDGRPYEYEYKYADLADIFNMALPKLSKHGISFNQVFRRREGKLLLVTRLEYDGEVLEDDGLIIPEQTVKPSEFGGYATYAKRYGSSAFLGIATEEDIDAPAENVKVEEIKKSTSEQPARRGRPPIPKTEAPKPEIPAPQSDENVHGVVVTDQDVPINIGNKPTKEEMTEIKKSLKSFGLESDKLKAYVLGVTNKESAGLLTKAEWDDVIKNLTAAQSSRTLAELVK